MKRWLPPVCLAVLLALAGMVTLAIAPWVDAERSLGLRWLYSARGPTAAPVDVTIVAIDEGTADQLAIAEHPRDWPRSLHADMVRALARLGVGLIVFDMTFDRPSADADQDAALASAMREAGNVVASVPVRKDVEVLRDPQGRPVASVVIERPAALVPVIAQALQGHAPFLLPKTARVDAFWTHLSSGHDAPTLPVLALALWRESLRRALPANAQPPPALVRAERALDKVRAGGDAAYLNFYGPPGTIRTLPYALVAAHARGVQAADGPASDGLREALRGKVVFIGFAARSLGGQDRLRDDHLTVFTRADGLNLSGVELAATAFANLLDDRTLKPLPAHRQLAVMVSSAVMLALLCVWLRPAHAGLAVGALLATYLWWVLQRFTIDAQWWPSFAVAAIQAPLGLLACLLLHYRRTQAERKRMARSFGYFVPRSAVEQMAQGDFALTQDNRVVYSACLATDVAGYTTLAEKMAPAALGQLLNDYFAVLFVPVERSGGVVIDVVGDAMVAIWTSPQETLDVRRKACLAALEIIDAVETFNRRAPARPKMSTRFGLHTGEVLLGNVGASGHYEYRAVGDIVNTATRIQDLGKQLGAGLMASAATVAGLDELQVRPLGSFRLPGKTAVLDLVELRGRRDRPQADDTALCQAFQQARQHHDMGRWQEAADAFARILADVPGDGPSHFYLNRCQALAAAPPTAGWTPTIAIDAKSPAS
jgi:adenylate cyclase